jgi:hypothetical protein
MSKDVWHFYNVVACAKDLAIQLKEVIQC